MNQPELFENTVNILVNAYHNKTLSHGNCVACAVGNIIAANCGVKDIKSWYEWAVNAYGTPLSGWINAFGTTSNGINRRSFYVIKSNPVAKKQIESTGYPVEVLADIEYAFETAPTGESDDDWMLNGLYAVYEVLCNFHQVKAPIPAEEVFVEIEWQ